MKLGGHEIGLLQSLRARRREERASAPHVPAQPLSTGQRIADRVAATLGSWPFIIGQSVVLTVWIALNITGWIRHWDPYPFILLNLGLSCQAAYATPVIMMSQNRQQQTDRQDAENDYRINVKAELEIELLHEKIDLLRGQEVQALTEAVQKLTALVEQLSPPAAESASAP